MCVCAGESGGKRSLAGLKGMREYIFRGTEVMGEGGTGAFSKVEEKGSIPTFVIIVPAHCLNGCSGEDLSRVEWRWGGGAT